jgi:hypothetical protein
MFADVQAASERPFAADASIEGSLRVRRASSHFAESPIRRLVTSAAGVTGSGSSPSPVTPRTRRPSGGWPWKGTPSSRRTALAAPPL